MISKDWIHFIKAESTLEEIRLLMNKLNSETNNELFRLPFIVFQEHVLENGKSKQ